MKARVLGGGGDVDKMAIRLSLNLGIPNHNESAATTAEQMQFLLEICDTFYIPLKTIPLLSTDSAKIRID
jgi:hypothetical protein